jgi:hypothetical protein
MRNCPSPRRQLWARPPSKISRRKPARPCTSQRKTKKKASPSLGLPCGAYAPQTQNRSGPEECRCGICGGQTHIIDFEQGERLGVEPVRYFVEVTQREERARLRWAAVSPNRSTYCAHSCADCWNVQKGVFANAFVLDMIEKKYAHQPTVYRQAQWMERDSGYAPSRSTLIDCVLEARASLQLVKEAMKAEFLSGSSIPEPFTTLPLPKR